MFKNVLVGVDGRPGGRDAIALASRLTDLDGNLTLAHVHSGALRPTRAVTPGRIREEREASEQLLRQERAASDVSAELISIEALSLGRGLHVQAEEQNADLLVVGSCSHGVFGRAMLGDDTRAALNGAPCAVAIAALGYAEHPTPIANVGVAYNGTPESKAALALARELAAPTRASIKVREVVSLPTYGYGGFAAVLVDSIDVMLEEANDRLKQLPNVEGRAVYGLTGEELASFGDEVDILVVGSRCYGPTRRLVLGSTSDYLERHARCSLLVLPRGVGAGPSDSGTEREHHAETRAAAAMVRRCRSARPSWLDTRAPRSVGNATGIETLAGRRRLREGSAIKGDTFKPMGEQESTPVDAAQAGEAASSERIRIVLADDHAVVRSGLRLLLDSEPDFEVVAEASDVDSARRYVRGHHPAVLVLDLNMPGASSLEAIPGIREESPDTQIVVLTMQQEPAFARQALSTGALGYVLKEAADDELVEAVRRAAAGESFLNPRLGARVAKEPPPGPPDDLSEREVDVLRLIALGHTNAEIAGRLYLSVRTVETHRSHIQQKLRLSTRAELVAYALERGLIKA